MVDRGWRGVEDGFLRVAGGSGWVCEGGRGQRAVVRGWQRLADRSVGVSVFSDHDVVWNPSSGRYSSSKGILISPLLVAGGSSFPSTLNSFKGKDNALP